MSTSTWEPWSKAVPRILTRYVTPEAVQVCQLIKGRDDILDQPDGRRKLLEALYDALTKVEISYAPEKYHPKEEVQEIRTPEEMIKSPKEGTCLDLSVLFCGLCLGFDLLPILIVIEGHAFVAVSLEHGLREWLDYGRKEIEYFEKGLLKADAAPLRQLIDDGTYVAIECTGFARSKRLHGEGGPEEQGRSDGFLDWEKATEMGRQQLEPGSSRSFEFALDIALLQHQWGLSPFDPGESNIRVSYYSGNTPDGYVHREELFEKIKSSLLDKEGHAIGSNVALVGPGGYGKTVLADGLCRDEDVRLAFYDGVYRIGIGKEPKNLIGLIVDLIEALTGKRPGFTDIDVAAEALSQAIDDAHLLLVIDDVWSSEILKKFLKPNRNCARLITTRLRTIVPEEVQRFTIDQLTEEQSYRLLSRNLEILPHSREEEQLRSLSETLDYWAQLLALAHGWIGKRVENGSALTKAIEDFAVRLKRKGLTSFDAKDESERDRAIGLCIEASLEDLETEERERLGELAIFPEDEEIPLDVVQTLWGATGGYDEIDSEDFCQQLYECSLLQIFSLSPGSIMLHDNILFFLQERVGEEKLQKLQKSFVQALAKTVGDHWEEVPSENQYVWKWLTWHLRQAGRGDEADGLLTDYRWIRGKLYATGAQGLFAEYASAPVGSAAGLVGRAVALSLCTLSKRPDELPHQLFGRLGYDELREKYPELRELVDEAEKEQAEAPMRCVRPSLSPPGPELLRFVGHEAGVLTAVFSPDEDRILTASEDSTARIWDVVSGLELHCLRGHEWSVNSAIFSQDGTRVVTGSDDSTARIWDAASGRELHCLTGHRGEVNSASFSPDGTRIITASQDKTARIWDAETGCELHCLRGHEEWVNSASFSPDSTRIVTASLDHTARIWDAASGYELSRLHEVFVIGAMFSENGTRIVTASFDKTARIWDAASGRELHRLTGHENFLVGAMFSENGTRIVTASFDKTARIWDAASGRELHCLTGHRGEVNSASFSPDGTRVVTASADYTACIWDAETGQELHCLTGHERYVKSAIFSQDGTRVVTGSGDSTARIWDAETGRELHCLRGHENWVNSASFSPDGTRVVTGSGDSTARIWDTETGQELHCLTGHKDDVLNATFSPDEDRILTASEDSTARIWDAASGRELHCLRGHEGEICCTTFSPDSTRILSGAIDHTARIWDVVSGCELVCLSFDAIPMASAYTYNRAVIGDALGRLHFLEIPVAT